MTSSSPFTRRHLLTIAAALSVHGLPTSAQGSPPALFHIVASGIDLTIGLTAAEAAALGSGPTAELLANRLAAEGRITAWQYIVGRGPDGGLRHVTRQRITITLAPGMQITPYSPALPVSQPPS